MRSAIVAAFAAGAIAVPFHARDIVTATDYDVVYATDMVTVTAGAPPSSTASPDTSSTPATTPAHYGHHSWWTQSGSAAPSSTPVSSSSEAAPTSTSSSVYVAPTSTSSSVYVAPTSASSSVYVAPTTSAAAPSSTWATSTSAAASAPTDYASKAVLHHNIHRANHSAPDLVWDNNLASIALTIAQSCVYAHNTAAGGGGYGQNIAAGVKSDNITAIITDLFYNGEVGWYDGLYGQAQPDMSNFEKWGHFSQIVWKGTTKVGCATNDCTSQGLANVGSDVSPFFTVCNYENPGNYANEYGANVGASLNKPTAEWNQGL